MSDLNKTEEQYTLIKDIACSLKLFVLGNLIWALPGIIPTMELIAEFTYGLYEWVAWTTNIIAIVFFFLSARKISKALKTKN